MIFAVFYVHPFGAPLDQAKEQLAFMKAGRRALEATNPGSRYVLLTDHASAAYFEREIEIECCAPGGQPLMLQSILAQRAFLYIKRHEDLIVLADTDCIPNRPLGDAIADGVAVTHRGPKFKWIVNNICYSRRHIDAWYLYDHAAIRLRTWPAEKQEWWGDQEALQHVLGIPLVKGETVEFGADWDFRPPAEEIFPAPGDPRISMVPCRTHNCFAADDGRMTPAMRDAYIVHFKGPRKQHLLDYVNQRFGG